MNSRFFKLAHDMLCIAGTDGVYRHVNPAWTRVLGWPSEEIEGRSFREFVHPDDMEMVEGLVVAIPQRGSIDSHHVRMRAANGSWRLVDFRTTFDAYAGEFVAAGRDVTEEVAMQRQLVAREQKLADVVAYQSQERDELVSRLAGELHDSAVQHNVAALMLLDTAIDGAGAASAEGAAEQVRLSLDALRRIMAGLDAVDDDVEDPDAGFSEIAHAVATQFRANIDCTVDGAWTTSSAVRRTAYRVAREGLVNACKHSDAGRISLAVNLEPDVIRIRIDDAGSSGPRRDGAIGLGRGLVLLDARVRSHGGDLQLSTSEYGSTLLAEIPPSGRVPDDPDGGLPVVVQAAMSDA